MTNATIKKLSTTIEEIDSLSQHGLSEIAATARLALAALENPRTCNNLNDFAAAFQAIAYKAADIENCINVIAEGVGCCYVDEALRRRLAAAPAAAPHGDVGSETAPKVNALEAAGQQRAKEVLHG